MEVRKQLQGGPIHPSPFSQQGVGARTWKRKPELCTQKSKLSAANKKYVHTFQAPDDAHSYQNIHAKQY